ncbi:MAG: hypothetical protein U5J99_14700 [Parvularculaceae bacterium]|nr:hypothetical protein [Parvularculaceae bacterium]
MGRTRFRILIGLIVFAHLVAASELGGLLGLVAIWAIIFAFVALARGMAIFPGFSENDLSASTAEAVLIATGLTIVAAAALQLIKASAAHRAGEHDEARRRTFSGLSIASVPTCLILSVQALADAWP